VEFDYILAKQELNSQGKSYRNVSHDGDREWEQWTEQLSLRYLKQKKKIKQMWNMQDLFNAQNTKKVKSEITA
jgi:Zn-finger nucleic acid-binding protein